MKIIFYMTTVLEYYGGMEKYLIDISTGLKNKNSILDISIVSMDNNFTIRLNKILSFIRRYKYNEKELFKEDLKSIQKQLGKVKYIKCNSFKELKKELSKADVVYSKNEILEAFILKFIIGYKNIKKLIFGCHTALYYPYGSKLHNLLYTTKIYNFLTSGVDKFHVLNSNDENVLKKLNKNVVKIFNPLNLGLFEQNINKNQFKINIDKNCFNIVWIGRLTKQKGIDFLIEIVEYISKNKLKNICVHIAGDGEEQNRINNLINKYKFIKYYGHIDNNYIPSFLSNMDLYIHTSLWESYGLTIIEANMVNIPVLAFNIPGPSDLIENGKNGFVFHTKKEYLLFILNYKNLELKNSKIFIKEKINDNIIYNNLKSLLLK